MNKKWFYINLAALAGTLFYFAYLEQEWIFYPLLILAFLHVLHIRLDVVRNELAEELRKEIDDLVRLER